MSYIKSTPSGTVADPISGSLVPDVLFGRLRRPSFKSNDNDTSQLVVPASSTNPAVVRISGVHYVLTKDKYLDLNYSGRNGLDAGTVAASTIYYLYAIPGEIETEFDLICSVQSPTYGPVGFTAWSYLGSFGTVASGALDAFRYQNGVYRMQTSSTGYDVTCSDAAVTARTLVVPTTISHVTVYLEWVTINASGDDFKIGPTTGIGATIFSQAATTAATTQVVTMDIVILSPPTVYTSMTSNTDDVTVRVMGWREDPLEWP